MKYGEIAGVNKPVSRMGQGTVMLKEETRDAGFELMDAVFEGGVTLFDSAYIYNRGECESVFGAWVRDRGVRDRVVMLDKGGHPEKGRAMIGVAEIRDQIATSLDRLGFDFIELYVLHRDDREMPVGEIVSLMSEHVREGRIRAWGGSNWTWPRVKEANEYAAANDLVPMAVSSPNFSLAIQVKPVWEDCLSISGPDHADAREWYGRTHFPLITWSSIARGFFSGRVTRENYESDDVIDATSRNAFCYPENFDRLDRLVRLAAEKGVTVPQAAVAYVFSVPLNIFALVGPQTAAEFLENQAAMDLALTAEEIKWLEAGEAGE